MTRGEFIHHVMKERSIPKTWRNRVVFMAWAQSEGGSASWNPLNTTLKREGSTFYNVLARDSAGDPLLGVQNYPTARVGIEATADTFDSPGQTYRVFEEAMKRGERAEVICGLIGASNWGTGTKLIHEVWSWIVRVPGVLRTLERKQVAS
jgi:hypothetical protein